LLGAGMRKVGSEAELAAHRGFHATETQGLVGDWALSESSLAAACYGRL